MTPCLPDNCHPGTPLPRPGGAFSANLRQLGRAVVDGLFPQRCAGCQRYTGTPGRSPRELLKRIPLSPGHPPGDEPYINSWTDTILANWFCRHCRERFTWISSPLCSTCGRMFRSRIGHDHPCPECTRRPPVFHRARACGVYAGSLKTVIQNYKYRGRLQWADPLGLLLYIAARMSGLLEACDLIMPVPLHPSRLRERGFNQSYLLLRRWQHYAAHFDPRRPLPPIDPHRLFRRHATRPQAGLPRRERQANVRGAFGLDDPAAVVQGKQILLVDDVFTTGATAAACGQALVAGGHAARVSVLTLAGTR